MAATFPLFARMRTVAATENNQSAIRRTRGLYPNGTNRQTTPKSQLIRHSSAHNKRSRWERFQRRRDSTGDDA